MRGKYTLVLWILVPLMLVFGYYGEVWLHGHVVSEHLFTEMLATILTVVGVDYLFERSKKRDELPRRRTAYIDVVRLVNSLVNHWHDAFRASVPESDPINAEALFTQAELEKVWIYLKIEEPIPLSRPPFTWLVRFANQSDQLMKEGHNVLDRNGTMDGTVYEDIHTLVTTSVFVSLLGTLRMTVPTMVQLRGRDPGRPTLFGTFGIYDFPTTDLQAIVKLIRWCEKERLELIAAGELAEDNPNRIHYKQTSDHPAPPLGIDSTVAAACFREMEARRAEDRARASVQG